MDSLTQIALGMATAHLVSGKELGRRSFLYGALLGTLPDLDVLVGQFLPTVEGVEIHRGLSHSLLFIALLSPVLGGLIYGLDKKNLNWTRATLLVLWCLTTHVLLDLFTSWGTQVFWPHPSRLALKTIFVVDPLYTLPLLISLVFALKSQGFNQQKSYILRGLYWSSIYLLLTCCFKVYALNRFQNALEEQKISYLELLVKPTALNSILWNANVKTNDAFYIGEYSLFDTQPITFKKYSRNLNLERQLAGNSDFERLKRISEDWYIVTSEDDKLIFNDLRFGLLTDDISHPQFAFSYVFVVQENRLIAQEVPKKRRDGLKLLQKIFVRLQGN